jgi:uncharacterized protein
MTAEHILIFLIGVGVGFLGGLFGKGGSAIATPLLHLIGIPGFVAVAAPLPATVPGTFVASREYWKSNLLDRHIVTVSIAVGVPATIAGSALTLFTGAAPLLLVTGLLVLFFGLGFFLLPREQSGGTAVDDDVSPGIRYSGLRVAGVALGVGLVSGLLANSGGFLLAPAYARILHMPIKRAFACSLAVSMALAIPGTIVHAYLGHIDWMVTLILGLGSVPFSWLGARTAITTRPAKLERWYGLMLTALGVYFLLSQWVSPS